MASDLNRLKANGRDSPELVPFAAVFQAFELVVNRGDDGPIFRDLSLEQNAELRAVLKKCAALTERIGEKAWRRYHDEVCPMILAENASDADIATGARRLQETEDFISDESEPQVKTELDTLTPTVRLRLDEQLADLTRGTSITLLDLEAAAKAYPARVRRKLKSFCRKPPPSGKITHTEQFAPPPSP